MVAIAFPTGSYPGRSRLEGAGRLINAYAEPLGEGAEEAAAIRRSAGLVNFATNAVTGYRGAMLAGGVIYAAHAETLIKISSTGVVTSLGDLDGTLPVSFARNNKTPTFDTVVVTEQGAFTVDASTGAASLVDGDLPQPTDVCFGDGYFFFPIADGRCFASGLNATTINALDVTQAEAKPDILMRSVFWSGYLHLFGNDSIEIYDNTGNATGFPFTRTAVVDGPGLGAKWGITGYEDGFAKALIYIGSDNAIHVLKGSLAVKISYPDIDRDIAAVSDKSTIRACSYIASGQAFVAFSCDDWTWEYNLTTQRWNERKSYLIERWRAEGNSVFAFGKWLVGDSLTGNILEISDTTFKEVDDLLPFHVESAQGKTFPYRAAFPRADFQFVKGVGIAAGEDPIERDPQVEISWSDDGGSVWSEPIQRKLGRQGKRNTQITVARCGRSGHEGRRWKTVVTDPVNVSLLGADMVVQQRAR
jgi:hypothetical protein